MIRFTCSIIILSLTLAYVGCNGSCSLPPPRLDSYQPMRKSPFNAQPVPTTDNLVVYLDTSASMAGYVSPDGKVSFAVSPEGQTVFSKTLLELRNVVTTMSPQPQIAVRKIDTNVSAPSLNDLDLSQSSINRSYYAGKETNLAGAIKTFSEPLDANAEDKSPPRFHILVTDGVQSSDKNNTNVKPLPAWSSIKTSVYRVII